MTDFCLGSPATARIIDRIDLLNRMSVHAGVSPRARQQAGPVPWYGARLRCLGCSFGEACRRTLALSRRSGEARIPTFCANHRFFSEHHHLGGRNEP